MTERIQSRRPRLQCMLLCAGWLLALPVAATSAAEVAVSGIPDAGILTMRNYFLSRLQAMPDLDVRAMRALDIAGRCGPATPCRETASVAGATAPPVRVSTMVCEMKVALDGRVLVQMAMQGRGRGPSCEVAQRDAPLQIAARLLSVLAPEVRDWSNEEQLKRMARNLKALERGADRLRELAPTTPYEALLEAGDDALRELEQ